MTNVKFSIKNVVALLLSLLLMLTMVSFPADVSALGLNKTSYTLTKGYAFTLKVSGSNGASVKWSSSDKSVASVSSSGKVVGKSVGYADIYADVNGTRLTCNVKVAGGKLSLSTKNVTLDEGDYKYVTVRAKGSHGLKAVPDNKSIVKASWVKPWDGDDIRLKLTALSEGTTTVKIYLTKYPDVYTTINVTVNGDDGILLTSQSSVTTMINTPASIVVYSDDESQVTYSLSDSTVAKVEQSKWSNNYCTFTITGLKAGTTNLVISRYDDSKLKKTIPITVSGSAYYTISTTIPSKTAYTDEIFRWTDTKTLTYKYMLLPANHDKAKVNYLICKDTGKFEYYTVFDTAPSKQLSSDSIQKFNAVVGGKTVERFVLVPTSFDKPALDTAVADYTNQFTYWTIYNKSPEGHKLLSTDLIKTWTATVNYKVQTRYMLVPEFYDQAKLDKIIADDSGVTLGGYYGVSTVEPIRKQSTDQILSFTTIQNNAYLTYYVLVPEKYDEARYNDVVASFNGYDYYKIYTSKPEKKLSVDEIQTWTKIVDSKSTTRYMLLPPGYNTTYFNEIKGKDLESQTSTYYVVSTTRPVPIDSTDTILSWYNSNAKAVKYMLLPSGYSVVKRNDILGKDTGTYNYYAMYSTKPAAKESSDTVLEIQHMTYGKIYMLVPKDYNQAYVNKGMEGIDVAV